MVLHTMCVTQIMFLVTANYQEWLGPARLIMVNRCMMGAICPLSGILFALCADILLRQVAKLLHGDSIICGYADDTGLVIEDYVTYLPVLAKVFTEFEVAGGGRD